jgi:hypothetical protein
MGQLSSAPQLAGVPKPQFLNRLAEYGVDTFDLTEEELVPRLRKGVTLPGDTPSASVKRTQAGMPVLLNLCFFARRDDVEPPANRSLTVTALFAACRFCYKLLNPKNARLKAGRASR